MGLFAIQMAVQKRDLFLPQNEYLIWEKFQTRLNRIIRAQYTYTQDNLILEVNSTSFHTKFYYDNSNRLIKEEVAISPDSYSSSMPTGMTHEFVDDKTGICMYSIYEYNDNGNLSKQLNYIPSNGQDELRSIRTFEYDSNNRISKVLLHDGDEVLTQYSTFLYDNNGNVIEENSYSYLFIPAGTGPTHLNKTTFEYDSYINPYSVFKQTGKARNHIKPK